MSKIHKNYGWLNTRPYSAKIVSKKSPRLIIFSLFNAYLVQQLVQSTHIFLLDMPLTDNLI